MSRVLAAIDTTPAAVSVLSVAAALAEVLGSDVDAIHVREGPWRAVRDAADAAGVPLTVLSGVAPERLSGELRKPDVEAIVVGARAVATGTRATRRVTGHVATHVATSTRHPVVVVPPACVHPFRLDRVLVPLEAVVATTTALRSFLGALADGGVEIVALHVLEPHALPPVTDQPHHEVDAFADEFLRRFGHRPDTRLELRTGDPATHVLAVAREIGADGIILGWNQRLDVGRASIVRSVLDESPIPVILLPVRPTVRGQS
jgi:nucleotide-binding universal stress UspA family protein